MLRTTVADRPRTIPQGAHNEVRPTAEFVRILRAGTVGTIPGQWSVATVGHRLRLDKGHRTFWRTGRTAPESTRSPSTRACVTSPASTPPSGRDPRSTGDPNVARHAILRYTKTEAIAQRRRLSQAADTTVFDRIFCQFEPSCFLQSLARLATPAGHRGPAQPRRRAASSRRRTRRSLSGAERVDVGGSRRRGGRRARSRRRRRARPVDGSRRRSNGTARVVDDRRTARARRALRS